ncbi:MAG: esterase-like activity of phytase family protein [Prosthecobacter sp.]|uniref:esterase-like activity of phytase family protein n=1 Tax=Prosthecobacter sp. TaxID=1965333 RepID=UPI0038FDC712
MLPWLASAAPFTPGNVVVYRVGAGGAPTLLNTGNPVFLDEYTPGGTLVQSVAMPTSISGANKRLIASGTASGDGILTRSVDGRYVIATGYDAAAPFTSLTSTAASTVNRVIGRVDASATVDTTTAIADAAFADNQRGAASINGTAFWTSGGATSGVRYVSSLGGTTSTQLSTTITDIRQLGIFGSQLYVASSAGAIRMGQVGAGVPTAAGQTIVSITGYPTSGANPKGFAYFDLDSGVAGVDTVYVADDGTTTGGIIKYSLTGGTWTSRGITGVATDTYRGITGFALGSTVTLYLTRKGGGAAAGGGELVSLVDAGGPTANITGTPTLIATAATNTAFRGVALAPQAILPDLIVTGITAPANASTGTNFSYTITVANSGTATANSVAARFTIPAGLNYVTGSGTSSFSPAHSAGIVNFTGGALAPGAVATLSVTVSTATAATYTAAVDSVTMDPSSAITETSESNNGNTSTAVTAVTMPNTPPSFTTHPANVSIANGATTTLTVLAAGSPVPTYQWYQGPSGNTSNLIAGATSASFTTPALFVNATYWVRATNTQGTADSTAALVTVAASSNANLSLLTVGSQLLQPNFDPADTSYITFVASTVTSMTVTPTLAMHLANLSVNGTALASGATSAPITLAEGANAIAIAVTAQDGTTLKTYAVNVFRSAPPLAAGAIAFIGFNADGLDDLAFVALTNIPDNAVIHFSDNEWNGTAFTDFLESEFVWMPPAGGIAEGSVVVISNIGDKPTASTSRGTIVFSDGTPGLGTTAESLYAFNGGTRAPEGFLAAISMDPAFVVTGTGLTLGSTAVKLTDSVDGAAYVGQRSGQATYASYLSLIGNTASVANWSQITDVSGGLGTDLLPFSTASFSLIGSAIYTSSNRDVLNPNRDVWTSAGVTLGSKLKMVNLGLQGVGRVPASQLDPVTGETIGSISDLQITGFTNNGNGSFSGSFHFMPDGGYRSPSIDPNFAARINTFSFTFTPYTGSTAITAQNQIAMTFGSSTRFTFDHDSNNGTPAIFTTGLTPTGVGTQFGMSVPVYSSSAVQSDGSFANRLCFTGEGLVLDKRAGKTGTGWISDEFRPGVYRFDSSKQLVGRVGVPEALVPRSAPGVTDFATTSPSSGRRDNQGLEGLAQSPDGTRLFAMMQSATIQESDSGNEGRFNTRVLVYDISTTDTPTAPIAQYILQLPRIDDTGSTTNGTTVTRTGGQSAIVALTNSSLLVLSRDGNGRGSAGSASPVFKSILLADLSSATNLGAAYDAEDGAAAPIGTLNGTITPVSWTQALNLVGGLGTFTTEVAKFGLNLNGGHGTTNTLSDKWEALGLVPVGDAANPHDFFLFIGNDNNFSTFGGKAMNSSGSLTTYNADIAMDSMVLAYRVRLAAPTLTVASQTPVANIPDNSATAHDFGSTAISGQTTQSFTITNASLSRSDSLSAAITGADAASYAITAQPTTQLSANGTSTLSIRFSPTSAGVKNASVVVTIVIEGMTTTHTFPITGTGASPSEISTWRQTYFGESNNTGNAADTFDADGDGIVNLLEFALNTVPTDASNAQGIGALPTGLMADSDSLLTDRFAITFRIPSPSRSAITLIVQVSDNLTTWTDVASKVSTGAWTWLGGGTSRIVQSTASSITTLKVGDSVSINSAPQARRMMRLKVTSP